jgi:hypothetical protein
MAVPGDADGFNPARTNDFRAEYASVPSSAVTDGGTQVCRFRTLRRPSSITDGLVQRSDPLRAVDQIVGRARSSLDAGAQRR